MLPQICNFLEVRKTTAVLFTVCVVLVICVTCFLCKNGEEERNHVNAHFDELMHKMETVNSLQLNTYMKMAKYNCFKSGDCSKCHLFKIESVHLGGYNEVKLDIVNK